MGLPVALPSHCGLMKSVYSQLNLSVKPPRGFLVCRSCKDEPTRSVEQEPSQRNALIGAEQTPPPAACLRRDNVCPVLWNRPRSPGRCLLKAEGCVHLPYLGRPFGCVIWVSPSPSRGSKRIVAECSSGRQKKTPYDSFLVQLL